MKTDQKFEIAREAFRSAMNGRKSSLSGSALQDIVSELATHVDITADGSVWWIEDDGSIAYRDGCFTSPYAAMRQMIDSDPQRFGIATAEPAPTASPVNRPVEVPAGNSRPSITELMQMAKANPALRERLIANPNGIPSSNKPSMTQLMIDARAGDASALAKLNQYSGKDFR